MTNVSMRILTMVGFAFTAILCVTSDAYAIGYRIAAAANCAGGSDFVNDGGGGLVETTASDGFLDCPIIDDDEGLHTSIIDLWFFVNNVSPSEDMLLGVCMHDPYSASFLCGTNASVANNAGDLYTDIVSDVPADWTDDDHDFWFAYVHIKVPAQYTSGMTVDQSSVISYEQAY